MDRSRLTVAVDGLYLRDAQGQIVRKEIPDAGDSGIHLRGSPNCEVNIWSQPMGSGDIQELHKDVKITATLRRAMLPKVKADAPFGQLNRFFITLKGDRVTVVLNDQTASDNAELPGIPAEGPIALQYHGDEVEFANVFIHVLPSDIRQSTSPSRGAPKASSRFGLATARLARKRRRSERVRSLDGPRSYSTDRPEANTPANLPYAFERTELVENCGLRHHGELMRAVRVFARRDDLHFPP